MAFFLQLKMFEMEKIGEKYLIWVGDLEKKIGYFDKKNSFYIMLIYFSEARLLKTTPRQKRLCQVYFKIYLDFNKFNITKSKLITDWNGEIFFFDFTIVFSVWIRHHFPYAKITKAFTMCEILWQRWRFFQWKG